MKRFKMGLILAFSLSTFLTMPICRAATLSGSAKPEIAVTDDGSAIKTAQAAEVNTIIARLKEIKSMDKSTLTSSEKKELKKEVRALKSHYKDISGGVYLSTGAIILLVVLLIILL